MTGSPLRFVALAMPSRAKVIDYYRANIPGLEVVWDRGLGPLDTFNRSLETIGEDAAVLMEDDAVLTRSFCAKATAYSKNFPNHLVQFHSRQKDDETIGSRWRAGSTFLYGTAVLYPRGMAAAVLQFGKTKPDSYWGNGIDWMVQQYMKAEGMRFYNVVPSLVCHLQMKSEIDPRRPRTRQARVFTDPELNAFPPELIFPGLVPDQAPA
jgi:hypothetical protein